MQSPLRSFARAPYICASCLSKSHRRLTTSARLRSTSVTPPPPPPTSGFAHLTQRSLVLLSGHGAPKFLQGLTTNNVDPSRRTPWYSGFLSAQGRVLWDALVYPFGQDEAGDLQYLLEVDREEVEPFLKHLKRHKLRSKVKMRDVREEWNVWAAWRQDGSTSASSERAEGVIATADPRLADLGDRILLSSADGAPTKMSSYEALNESSIADYTVRRYLHGVAEGQKEILRESALPMESNMDYLNGIDFRKGCYVGQELTIRTQHTGVIRKRILPIQLYDSSTSVPSSLEYSPDQSYTINQGTDIKAEGGRRPAGKFLASVGNIGLALCRLENMTDMRVSAEGGTYKEGVEFSVAATEEGAEKIKVKAFVPEWLREREQEKMERRARKEDPAIE